MMVDQNLKNPKRILIMAGGTGGHVFPGLTVADYLRAHEIEVHWLGTAQGLEAQLVPDANIPLHFISISGLRGKGAKAMLNAPLNITSAVFQAGKIIKKIKPDVVIGMGGFASGPGGLASWMLGYPLIIHEQNAKPGTTNKILMRLAKKVLEGFPSTFPPQAKVITVGNPVRAEIERVSTPERGFNSQGEKLKLLILGGSQGAKSINEIIPHMLLQLREEERPVVLHQTGTLHFDNTKKLYETYGLQGNIKPFIKEMAEAYAWADLVLCRAGALTVSELCAVGLGAIFIPFPYAIDDHQTANANFMVKNKAALCIQQKNLTADRLAAVLKEFTLTREKCQQMAQAAYSLRKMHVSAKIFDIICNVSNKK